MLTGIDLEEVEEVEASLARFGQRYTAKLFTDREIESSMRNPRSLAENLTECFAGKEAVRKILGSNDVPVSWKSIEVRHFSSGRRGVILWKEAAELAHNLGIDAISLSTSVAGGIASAAVLARSSR